MTSDKHLEAIFDAISEAEIKLMLVQDYLQRFQITDVRLVAPLKDIDRCISFASNTSQHMQDDGTYDGDGY